jgi:Family of unknown function (DUF6529)
MSSSPDPTAASPVDDSGPAHAARGRSSGTGAVLVTMAVGAMVAVSLGVYGRLHEPTFFAVNVAGFSSPQAVKAWLASAAFLLALVQLGSALVMWGKVPGVAAPSWIGGLHRWSGRLAVLTTVPVAVHCLYALGFDWSSPRVLMHSLLGCFFYGVFVTKMLVLSRSGLPDWSLPVIGGATFTALTGLWLTSSVWFFTTFGLTF